MKKIKIENLESFCLDDVLKIVKERKKQKKKAKSIGGSKNGKNNDG